MVSLNRTIFDKYNEFADEMIASFGVLCGVYYVNKIVQSGSVDNVKISKSLRPFDKRDEFKQTDSYTTSETSENIRLRVYWDRKSFKKIGDMVIPDGGIMTIGYLSDMPKLRSCEYLKPNIENEAYLGYEFKKLTAPIPWAFKKERYCVCGWEPR